MKTFTTQEQDQMMEYATNVAKYSHMVAFLTAYPKGDAEMRHCKENLEFWVKKQMEALVKEEKPSVRDGCQYCGDYMECDFGDCDCECHKPPSIMGVLMEKRRNASKKESD